MSDLHPEGDSTQFERFTIGTYKKFGDSLKQYLGMTKEAEIPVQAYNESCNCLSHLFQYFNPALSDDKRRENLRKAENHIVRATLDVHKIIYFSMAREVAKVPHSPSRVLSLNAGTSFWVDKKQYDHLAREARKHEMSNVGNNTDDTIKKYDEATAVGVGLCKHFNDSRFRWLILVRSLLVLIVIILSGLVGFGIDRLVH